MAIWDETKPILQPVYSVTISNKSYIGANPDVNQLSAFSGIPGGTYTAKIKRSGTQNVIAAFPLSTTLAANRIVTLYVSGTAQGNSAGFEYNKTLLKTK